MEMPKPSEAHAKYETMAGNWAGTETMYPSPWDPEGGAATARMSNRVALGGFAMVGDYVQERNGVTSFTGHSVHTYDPKEQLYVLHWWDSMGMPVNVFRGRFEGDKLTMSCVDFSGHWRMMHDYSTPGTIKSKMETSPDGQNWTVFYEGTYGRVAAESAKAAAPASRSKKKVKKPVAKKPAKIVKKKKSAKPKRKKAKVKRR